MERPLNGLAIGPDQEVSIGLDDRQVGPTGRNLPWLGILKVIGQVKPTNVNRLTARIVELDPIVILIKFVSQGMTVLGLELINDHGLTIGQARQQQKTQDKYPSEDTMANTQTATWKHLQGNTLPTCWDEKPTYSSTLSYKKTIRKVN